MFFYFEMQGVKCILVETYLMFLKNEQKNHFITKWKNPIRPHLNIYILRPSLLITDMKNSLEIAELS